MADLDFTNPVAVIIAFFSLFITALMFLLKMISIGFAGLFLLPLVALLWFKTFGEK